MEDIEWIRIGILIPSEVGGLVAAGEDALDEDGRIERQDVELHADLLQLRLEELRERQRRTAAGDDEHLDLQRLLPFVEETVVVGVEPAEGVEDVPRFAGIELDDGNFRVVRPRVGRERTGHRARGAVIEIVDQRFQIDAHRERAADAFVADDRIAAVPRDVVVAERVEAAELEPVFELQVVALVEPDVGADGRLVEIATLQCVPCGGVVDDHLEEHVFDVRLLRPVVFATLEENFFSGDAAREAIRSAADRARNEVVAEVAGCVDVLRNREQLVEAAHL